ncbi:UDP-glucose 4-epimerase GalE [Kitasatospora aureofaciens]|uniref:UDP-glucose 4-epimerase n=1 Tax=Kitasatospora aureofaciens TaxID=1894 RepID=A0A1E7N6J2_KITAU|nr:UDP-glucose 4-epimerase GalE [Kitasatospora aureofaciens]QEU98204.1 UDP-glucose 4-epimerase GalE [Streptomyces viridifaciens]ARF82384.1 UDP-glucose 4-epimerase GalE [Kitasatospora aureofaciens]OEV36326.1 UDP-glucose 4-epimerase GalE [Kitasatospora aureofaciens]UKZ04092.1 UDP-glucose 4-epimerase GalE [Streptomyces viridifaciens]GGU70523.1 UDP-glucose 4-epimerase [Kitasatospora aureofaciens]
MRKVLITGGAGFIGSTVASALLDRGITPVVLDDLSRGRAEFVEDRVFYDGDIADAALLERIFTEHPDIDATVHCAARIVVPESVAKPLFYYRENVAKTVELLDALQRHGCTRVVFSSSASIYAPTPDGRVDENSPVEANSPYARTKLMMEQVLQDWTRGEGAEQQRVIALRYFNPIGADPRLRTGLQNLNPSHALGKLIEAHTHGTPFTVTGVDWPTRDGSGIRDYVHVQDLAEAHVAALLRFDEVIAPGAADRYRAINVGTGEGTTVRELVAAFERAVGTELDVREAGPRPGDVIGCYASVDAARELLGWTAKHSLAEGVADALAWRARWATRLGVS